MTLKLSGPFKLPFGIKKPDKLFIFLHGVGSDGHDLISLAEEYSEHFPSAVFLSPNAPFAYDMYPMGYQWFSLKDYNPDKLYQGVQIALPILKQYIDENLEKFNLHYKDLVLIGFSQGSMMALQLAPRLEENCFGVIGFSGALIKPEEIKKEKKSSPPICLIHGEQDEVVTIDRHYQAAKDLEKVGLLHEEHVIKNLGHSINQQALNLSIEFLKNRRQAK